MPNHKYPNYLFILGGPDKEMYAIIDVLKKNKIDFIQPCFDWDKRIINKKDLDDKIKLDKTRVYVECSPNKYLAAKNDVLIDHHGPKSHLRSALIQVKKLLGLPITQHDLWLEAWDRQGVKGTLSVGAPKKLVYQWIKQTFDYKKININQATDKVKKIKTINNLWVLKVKPNTDVIMAHLIEYLIFPTKKPLLLYWQVAHKLAGYKFFGPNHTVKKLHRQFSGFYGGNPKKNSMFWGVEKPKWKIPELEKVISLINNN